MQALTNRMPTLGDALAQFAHLETIVLETCYRLGVDDAQALLKSLRKACRVEVQHRTCEEAHQVALQAKKSPDRSVGAGLLSPFWCLKEHGAKWRSW